MNTQLNTNADQASVQRIAELETLLQIDRELNSRLDFEQVLDTVRKWITRVGKTDRVWIFIVQEEEEGNSTGSYVFPQDYTGDEDELIEQAMMQANSKVTVIKRETQIQLVAPILYRDKTLGAFLIQREQPFSESEVYILELLFNRSAATIANVQLNRAVQRANQDKSKFVSLVTHELRNPMTCIKGYADLLTKDVIGPINEQQRNFINVIRKSAEWMSTLVSDLADFSRIESGRLELDKAFIPVQDCIEETLKNLRSKIDDKQQNLVVDIDPGLPNVYVDPYRLSQIMKNLLSNAWKFTPNEGDIRINAKSQERYACIEVVDNGIGIRLEDQPKLFSKFFRSEDPAVREEPGWGLGLYMAKRLVEIMGGDIGYRSMPGEGSTFWFTIPVFEIDVPLA